MENLLADIAPTRAESNNLASQSTTQISNQTVKDGNDVKDQVNSIGKVQEISIGKIISY